MPGRAREEAWKEKERGQENRQAEGGAAMDREGGMERDGSMRGGAAELGAAMEAGVPPQELAAAAVAVGRSVQMKSTVPLCRSMTMAGAVSAGALIWASGIWGRQESYQMVAICAVQVPPERSLMPAALA